MDRRAEAEMNSADETECRLCGAPIGEHEAAETDGLCYSCFAELEIGGEE